MWFFEKPYQGLSNAPIPKCFGQIFAEIIGFEVYKKPPRNAFRGGLRGENKTPPLTGIT